MIPVMSGYIPQNSRVDVICCSIDTKQHFYIEGVFDEFISKFVLGVGGGTIRYKLSSGICCLVCC